jgi:ComF family protein
MNIMDRLVSTVAPHICLGCGKEGSLLCKNCSDNRPSPPSRCYRCHKASIQFQVCSGCRKKTGLSHVWIACDYEDIAKELVHYFKFERARAAADDIAGLLDSCLPILPDGTIVTHIPTVSSRIRQRGYDQAQLIARGLARKRAYQYRPLLERTIKTRQVGAKRQDRFAQLQSAFSLLDQKQIEHQRILLVDDVLTTGATLESAAAVLRTAGACSIDGLVFAH